MPWDSRPADGIPFHDARMIRAGDVRRRHSPRKQRLRTMKDSNRSISVSQTPKPVRALARQQVKPQAFNDPRLRAVANVVHGAIAKSTRVSLGEAARIAHYSPQHFSEFFHDRVGLSFDTWQFALRMEQAVNLLAQKPWMPADAVASVIGYSHPSAFSRAFKRYAGINCRQFLRLARTCPTVAAELAEIERLDYAYTLVMPARKISNIVPLLLRLVERMRAMPL